MINFSSAPYLNQIPNTNDFEVNSVLVIRELVTKIDGLIALTLVFIISCIFLCYILLPRAKIGLEDMRSNPLFSAALPLINLSLFFVDRAISFTETFFFGSAIFLLVIAHYQGLLSRPVLLLLYLMLGVTLVVFAASVIGFIRSGKLKKSVVSIVDDLKK